MKKPSKIGYIFGVDFQYHIGEDLSPTKIFSSAEILKKETKCWKQCGIVKIEVTEIEWVEKQDFDNVVD